MDDGMALLLLGLLVLAIVAVSAELNRRDLW
jgi:hypothetical protein